MAESRDDVENANEAVIDFFVDDLQRAHRLLVDHFPRGDGYCHHQGTFHRPVRWPCRLYVLACRAVLQHTAMRRLNIPPPRSPE